jgi:hypothetical protein
VKAVRGDVLAVAHEGNPGAFTIYPGEYEAHNCDYRSPTRHQRSDRADIGRLRHDYTRQKHPEIFG